MRGARAVPPGALFLLTLLSVLAAPAEAQRPGASGGGWAPAQAGLRVGWDNNANATVAGGQLRIPVLPGGSLELVPSGDVTFLTGLREYQVNLDAVWVLGGRRGGLYGGGGLAARNTIFGESTDGERETRTGANVVVGLTTRGRFGGVPLGVQIEARWVFLDAAFDPRVFTFGLNVPLWGWGRGS
jgi:hypothetical protein